MYYIIPFSIYHNLTRVFANLQGEVVRLMGAQLTP